MNCRIFDKNHMIDDPSLITIRLNIFELEELVLSKLMIRLIEVFIVYYTNEIV